MSAPTEGPLGQTLTASASGTTTAPELTVVTRLVDSERYELRGEHGRGGLGVVLRTFDRQLGREVALKVLQNDAPAARRRFLREATITSRLQHPSIVTVHDVVELPGGAPSYTMPLYPGRSLRAAIQDCADVRARLALLPKVLAVAEAIAHAHGRQVIHRDIKPSNVLLGSLGETVVIDWGLAKSLDERAVEPSFTSIDPDSGPDETRTGEVMGTPAYMAPEQARGERVDQRADIYALGALLYHVLSGQPPYRGRETGQLLRQLLQGPPPDMERDLGDAPPELVAIVRKAMAREREERYPSADALAADLRRFLDGVLVEAHEYTPRQLLARWVARHRVLVATVGLAVTLLALVIALAFRRVQDERAVAQASAAHERSRASAMILTQAETVLAKDPTRAIAWLKTYPADGEDWVRLRAIARDAVREGVARHELRRTLGSSVTLVPRADGRHMLLVDGARTVQLWDLVTGGKQTVACLPDDLSAELRDETGGHEVLFVLTDGRVLVWSEALGAPQLVATVPGAQSASISSNGRWVAIADTAGLAQLVDRQTGAWSPLAEGDLPVADVRFVPGTERLLLLGGAPPRAERLMGDSVSVAGSSSAVLYDVAERAVVTTFLPGISYVAVSTRGPHFVLVRDETVDWVDALDLNVRSLVIKPGYFHPVDFTSDGRVAIVDRLTKKAQLWDPRLDVLAPLTVRGGAIGVSPEASAVASLNGESASAQQLRHQLDRNLLGYAKSNGRAVTFVDETHFAAGTDEGLVRFWDLTVGKEQLWSLGKPGYDPPFALVADDTELIAASQGGRVIRRSLAGGDDTILFDAQDEVAHLAATPDGAIVLVATARGALIRHDAHRGVTERLFEKTERVSSLVLTRDGRYAAAPGLHGGSAFVWDLERRQQRELDDLRGNCYMLEVSPDQRSLAIGCSRGSERGVLLHDLDEGTTRVLPAPYVELRQTGFSPSGRYLYAAVFNGDIIRWDLATGTAEEREFFEGRCTGGAVLTDDLFLSFCGNGIRMSSFALRASASLDSAVHAAFGYLSRDRSLLVGADNEGTGPEYVWDLRTHERWTAPRFKFNRPAFIAQGGELVSSSSSGSIHIIERPPSLTHDPARTHAWLESLTSVELDDPWGAGLVCP